MPSGACTPNFAAVPKDVLHLMERIAKAGAGFRSLNESVDTTTPAGRMGADTPSSPGQLIGDHAPNSDNRPASNCFGVGGQPRMTRSTGTTVETPPTTA